MHHVYCLANGRYYHKCGHDISVYEYCTNCDAEVPPHETLVVRSRVYSWVRHFELWVRRRYYKQQQQQNVFTSKRWFKNNRESHSMCRIQDLQILYNEIYDVVYANNKSYEVLILLGTMTILTNTVPITYSKTTIIKFAILRQGHF